MIGMSGKGLLDGDHDLFWEREDADGKPENKKKGEADDPSKDELWRDTFELGQERSRSHRRIRAEESVGEMT